ncbi:MAG: CRISPR-associated helicase Cas3' [Rhodococcus sp. (in: high G+C Gram-positive bacteria)]
MLSSAWAKYRYDTDESLSLVRHSEDAAAIAAHLWNDWLPASTKAFLSDGSPEVETRALAQWLAGTHDVGKLSPAFAVQVPVLAGRMRDAGLRMRSEILFRTEVPHSLVSHRAIRSYFEAFGWGRRVASSYAVVAGGHHGVPPALAQLRDDELPRHYGGPEWRTTRDELIGHVSEVTGADQFFDTWKRRPLSPQQQVLWTGFVIVADWIASSDYFSLGHRSESIEEAAAAWDKLDLPPPWQAAPPSTIDELMHARFDLPAGATPNPVQRAVVEAARAMAEPGLVIVEAAMGIGKTEAALAASEYLAEKFGQGGVLVALPTMATSNAMFRRVKHWIEHQDPEAVSSLTLAHGKASLEDSYRGLMRRSRFTDIGRDVAVGDRSSTTEVIAHHWFSGRKKALLAEFAVGTIDQLLFAGLKARHLALRHLALVSKVVIVDEVHAADVYMMQYLIRVLEWLGAYRVPVVLLSATLPASQRIALVSAYEIGRGWSGDDVQLAGDIGYPSVTVVDGTRRVIQVESTSPPVAVGIERLDDSIEDLVARLRRDLADGGCVGIVRNTVRRAQETARALAVYFPGSVTLVHSRFVAQHRADLESRLVSELGRTGVRPHLRIVVGTQVIEQSLDVDFDLMVSDLAPIDLLFQRIGRLHRHSRGRPAALSAPRLLITGVEEWSDEPPQAIQQSRGIYGDLYLMRALAVLAGKDAVTLPSEIASLVQAAYDDNFTWPTGWADAGATAEAAFRTKVAELESRASTWRIWQPSENPTLVDWLKQNVGEVDDARGQAKVRDTEEGVDVLLTKSVGGQVYLLDQCGGGSVETTFPPEDALARRVLTSSVKLPREFTHPGIVDQTIDLLERQMYGGWQESKWLAGELVLELDGEMSAMLLGFDIRYDSIEGLVVNRSSEKS